MIVETTGKRKLSECYHSMFIKNDSFCFLDAWILGLAFPFSGDFGCTRMPSS